MKKEYLLFASEMKQLDHNAIEITGIPALVLMERAALEVAKAVMRYLNGNQNAKILVIAGNGNNGADGICAGRILKEYGYFSDVCILESSHEYSSELILQRDIALKYSIPFLKAEEIEFTNYDVVIDSIFGIGLNRDIEGCVKDFIQRINEANCYIVSVDIPSGINATNGKICGIAIKADETVTFGFYKAGQFLYPGREYCGKVNKAVIGISEVDSYGSTPSMFAYFENNEKIDYFRSPMGNKGTFGKVLVIAGRASTTGAALLCAKSAFRSGCGMVAVVTEEDNKESFMKNLPEAMLETYHAQDTETAISDKLNKWLQWADVVVIGCGIGKDEIAYKLLYHTVLYCGKPMVFDADALQLFAGNNALQEALAQDTKRTAIFTPHPGELAALAHCEIADIKINRLETAKQVCDAYGVILVSKDADTLCVARDEMYYLNTSGNDGMATAGSGDVLAGLIASMVAQAKNAGISVFDAVCIATYIHGLAGDWQAKECGKRFMVASDIIEAYKYILK